jgi:hypothetical protein
MAFLRLSSPLLAILLAILSLLAHTIGATPHAVYAAAEVSAAADLLVSREQTTTSICTEYSSVANLSTIGLNSTYRAAFLQSSPTGTLASAKLMNDAEAKISQYQFNETTNDECGNLTALAITGAAANFSMGIVAEFKISGGGKTMGGVSWGAVVLVGLVTMSVVLV